MEFTYDGGGLGKEVATSSSTSTANRSGEVRVEGTVPMLFSADDDDVGSDTRDACERRQAEGQRVHRVRWVQLDIDAAAETRIT